MAYNPLKLLGISVELGLFASLHLPLTVFAILVTMITDYLMRVSWHSMFSELALINLCVLRLVQTAWILIPLLAEAAVLISKGCLLGDGSSRHLLGQEFNLAR